VIRHKLMDMALKIDVARCLVYDLAYRIQHRPGDPAPARGAHRHGQGAGHAGMQFCADAAVQILGGMGFMRGTKSERIYREVKVMMIGGGSEEIMKDLAAPALPPLATRCK
jgi:acyl-CoA dehydrogenase